MRCREKCKIIWDEVRTEITDVSKEITEVKQTLEGFISRMDKMQEAIDE